MELTQGSETSANYNSTPGKYPKEHIQYSNHGESLKSTIHFQNICTFHTTFQYPVSNSNKCVYYFYAFIFPAAFLITYIVLCISYNIIANITLLVSGGMSIEGLVNFRFMSVALVIGKL
jgi:hypothetical protein